MAECVAEVSPVRWCGPTAEEALGYQYCPVSLMVLGFLGQEKPQREQVLLSWAKDTKEPTG